MPAALTELPAPPLSPDPPRKRWTRRECAALDSLLDPQHLELVEGELISKIGKKRPHVIALTVLQAWALPHSQIRIQRPPPARNPI